MAEPLISQLLQVEPEFITVLSSPACLSLAGFVKQFKCSAQPDIQVRE